MSIYIQGMEMPKEGKRPLWAVIHSDGVVEYNMGDYGWKTTNAIEVPPHGRVIDADAAINDIWGEILEHQMNGMKGTPFYIEDLRAMWQRLEDEDIVPTIIPAGPAKEGKPNDE